MLYQAALLFLVVLNFYFGPDYSGPYHAAVALNYIWLYFILLIFVKLIYPNNSSFVTQRNKESLNHNQEPQSRLTNFLPFMFQLKSSNCNNNSSKQKQNQSKKKTTFTTNLFHVTKQIMLVTQTIVLLIVGHRLQHIFTKKSWICCHACEMAASRRTKRKKIPERNFDDLLNLLHMKTIFFRQISIQISCCKRCTAFDFLWLCDLILYDWTSFVFFFCVNLYNILTLNYFCCFLWTSKFIVI